jgi:hypothetical protein
MPARTTLHSHAQNSGTSQRKRVRSTARSSGVADIRGSSGSASGSRGSKEAPKRCVKASWISGYGGVGVGYGAKGDAGRVAATVRESCLSFFGVCVSSGQTHRNAGDVNRLTTAVGRMLCGEFEQQVGEESVSVGGFNARDCRRNELFMTSF